MTWPEFTGHLKELHRRRDPAAPDAHATPPHTWAGARNDPFWQGRHGR